MNTNDLLTKKDLEDFKAEIFDFISKKLNSQIKNTWLKGDEARELLKCGNTKLSELVRDGFIETRGKGRGKLYSSKSINQFVKNKNFKAL